MDPELYKTWRKKENVKRKILVKSLVCNMAEQCFCSQLNHKTPLTGNFTSHTKTQARYPRHLWDASFISQDKQHQVQQISRTARGIDGEQLPKGPSALSLVTWSVMVREQHGSLRKSFLQNIRHTVNTFISQTAKCLQALRFTLPPRFSILQHIQGRFRKKDL